MLRAAGIGLLMVAACSCSSESAPAAAAPPDGGQAAPDAGGDAGGVEDTDASSSGDSGAKLVVRVAAANTTSGASTSYDPIESIRIFQGLHLDLVVIQELKYGANTPADIQTFVTTAFGATYTYYREPTGDIPNGVVSRYPIADSGSWVDPNVANRGFAWAKIAIPSAPHPLWAVSLHLLTTNATDRSSEATALVAKIKEAVPAGDYLVVGGDLNTAVRDEPCINALSEVVGTTGPYPDDGYGNDDTNQPRNKPHDWLMAGPSLTALAIPLVIGAHSFPHGLVFDSRVYSPIGDVAPIMQTDSDALNMQHMPVVRDFAFPQ